MSAQAATQASSTCGECGFVFVQQSAEQEHGNTTLQDVPAGWKQWRVKLCPLHAQAEATAEERDALLAGATMWSFSDHWWPCLRFGLMGLGAFSNGVAVLANGGYMPVMKEDVGRGVWRSVEEGDRLLWLVDRFDGYSIGDIILFTALALGFWVWTITSALRYFTGRS